MQHSSRLKPIALLLAAILAASLVGCGGESDSSNSESSAAESSESTSGSDSDSESSDDTDESSDSDDSDGSSDDSVDAEAPTESDPEDMAYQLEYDSDSIPEELANTLAAYFYAVETQNYDLYVSKLDPDYLTATEEMLEENYSSNMESSMEMYHQSLIESAGTEDFTITSIEMSLAQESLAENYDSGTDFVEEYLSTFAEVLGEDFTTQLEEDADAFYDVALTITGTSSDGEEVPVMSNLEVLVVEKDGSYGVLG